MNDLDAIKDYIHKMKSYAEYKRYKPIWIVHNMQDRLVAKGIAPSKLAFNSVKQIFESLQDWFNNKSYELWIYNGLQKERILRNAKSPNYHFETALKNKVIEKQHLGDYSAWDEPSTSNVWG